MRLATIRVWGATRAVRVEDDSYVECGFADVGALLRNPTWRTQAAEADGARHDPSQVELAPVVPHPGKIICVGLNYRSHILEMGRELPSYPTLFAKFPEALIGPFDDLVLPAESDAVDWEAELAVVLGKSVRRADRHQAEAAIAGYSIVNDVTMRDWQFRTREWLQGKTFEATTPFGPCLATPEELPDAAKISCTVDGEVVQSGTIDDLVFGPADLVEYVSTILTLNPGDVIITGTTGGVGHARTPARYLADGQVVITEVEGIGALRTFTRAQVRAAMP